MRKKLVSVMLAAALAAGALTARGTPNAGGEAKTDTTAASQAESTEAAKSEETKAEETTAAEAKDTGDLKTVSIQIDGSAVPYYAPLYLAQENGYLRKRTEC